MESSEPALSPALAQLSIAVADSVEKAFPLFPELPAELQLKVWFHALPGPRVIEIDHRATKKDNDFYNFGTCRSMAAISEPLPLLHTCRDSRAECLKRYSLSFTSILHYPVYFDPRRDIALLANMDVLLDLSLKKDRSLAGEDIHHLALNTNWNRSYWIWRPDYNYSQSVPYLDAQYTLRNAVKLFATLRNLTLFLDKTPQWVPDQFKADLEHLLVKQREDEKAGTRGEVDQNPSPPPPPGTSPWRLPQIVTLDYQPTEHGPSRSKLLLESQD